MTNKTMDLKNWCEENNIDYVYIHTTETIKDNTISICTYDGIQNKEICFIILIRIIKQQI